MIMNHKYWRAKKTKKRIEWNLSVGSAWNNKYYVPFQIKYQKIKILKM